MTDIDYSELKCCPFCGGEAELFYCDNWYQLCCKKCGASAGLYGKIKNAIRTWNTRISDLSDPSISKHIDKPITDVLDKLSEAKKKR